MGKHVVGDENEDESVKMIKKDEKIQEKIIELYKKWRNLDESSWRMNRCILDSFKSKVKLMEKELFMPFNVCKQAAEAIIKSSGIIDWEEETKYLRSQLSIRQAGCPGSWDSRQKKRDDRKERSKLTADAAAKTRIGQKEELSQRKSDFEKEHDSDTVEDNNNGKEYVNIEPRKKKIKKFDVMGRISLTADGLNLSVRNKTFLTASVSNALGVDLDQTNISKSTAWRQEQKIRLKKAEEILQDFKCPDKVVIHWDRKTLSLKGRLESKRVCVYLSGVNAEKVRKLLGIPETSSGRGVDEFELVRDYMMKWNIKNQTIGMVFDTTNSNSGEHNGACKFLEIWVGKPVLWLACRRHTAELHLGAGVKAITGLTKDPGVALFRRLRDEWYKLDINMDNLDLFDHSSVSADLQREAKEVLVWAEKELEKNTFPRDDWREFMELVVVSLGGYVEGFCFKLPGPDHHARWMSKCI